MSDVSRMDEVIKSYVADKEFMGSVLVAQNGKVLLSKGYGYANLEWEVPNSPTAKFRLGSLNSLRRLLFYCSKKKGYFKLLTL